MSAPCWPNCGGRAHIFPATRAPPAEQVSTRSPEAQSSSSRRPVGTVPAAPPSARGRRARGSPAEVGGMAVGLVQGQPSAQPVSGTRGPDWGSGRRGVVHGWRIAGPVSRSCGFQSVHRGAGGLPSSLISYCREKSPQTNFTGEVSAAAFPAPLAKGLPHV